MRMRRIRRRRAIAIALLPATAMTIGFGTAGATSAAGQDQAAKATFQGKSKVRYGDRLTIRGEFPESPNAKVEILQRKAGANEFRQITQATTNANGRWSKRVKPRVTGSWMAQLAEEPTDEVSAQAADRESGSKRIRVRSVTQVVPSDRNATAGETVRMRGHVKPGGQRKVKIKVGGKTLSTRTNSNGRFDTTWKAPGTGSYSVKAFARGNKLASGSQDKGGTVDVFRSAQASWYGPGLYGNRTACGQTLTSSTKGVANKSLPCGTKLTIRYRGRSVTTTVIDRGPYHGNREFDLTYATKKQLGFGDTGSILVNK